MRLPVFYVHSNIRAHGGQDHQDHMCSCRVGALFFIRVSEVRQADNHIYPCLNVDLSVCFATGVYHGSVSCVHNLNDKPYKLNCFICHIYLSYSISGYCRTGYWNSPHQRHLHVTLPLWGDLTGDQYIPHTEGQGAVSIRKTVLPGMVIPMFKIRRPNGRLIFNMEIAIHR